MERKNSDPRESLAERLVCAGVDDRAAFFIALDAGLGVVDKEYLIGSGLKGKRLKAVEGILKDFYWDKESFT